MSSPRAIRPSATAAAKAMPGKWAELGACRNKPIDWWFPAGVNKEDDPLWEQPRAICRNECPVRSECRDLALATRQDDGMWGGLTPPELRRLRRNYEQARKETG